MSAVDAGGARRIRMLALLLPVLAAAAAFLAWSQPWVSATLDDGRVVVAGGDAEQHEQAGPDPGRRPPVDAHGGSGNALHDGSHVSCDYDR